MHALRQRFNQLTHALENHPASLWRFAQLFLAILAVRLVLEFFSNHRLFSLQDVAHIGLWFVFVVLAFVLQLHLFARVPMQRILRMAIVCYAFSWSAPLLDLLVGPVGARMSYLSLHDWKSVALAYLTVGGSSMVRGATLGIRIEIVLLVVACIQYVHAHTGSRLRAVAAAWCIYTTMFVSGAIHVLLGLLVSSLGLTYGPGDQSTLLLFLVVDLVLFGAVLAALFPSLLARVVRAVPHGVVLVGVLHGVVGAGLARAAYPDNVALDPTTLFWFPLGAVVVACLALTTGLARVPRTEAGEAALLDNAVPLVLAVLLVAAGGINGRVMFVATATWSVLYLRDHGPWPLRDVPVMGSVALAGALVLCALLGFCALGGPMVGFPTAWLAALSAAGLVGALLVRAARR